MGSGRCFWGAPDDAEGTRKGPWTFEEDTLLINYISFYGDGRWDTLAKASGLKRTGKSCRLRWMNYLRPDLKRSRITAEEERLIIDLHRRWGNRWSRIAQCLPGRTDNEIKNFFRTHIRRKANRHSRPDDSDESTARRSMVTETASGNRWAKSSLRYPNKRGETVVDTELTLCPQEIRPRDTQSGEEESRQHGHVEAERHYRELQRAAESEERQRHPDIVGSLNAIMSDFYGDGFHHYGSVSVHTASCSTENSSDDETFVDYSDELWNINSDGRPRIRKCEDH